jgi:hypothetical protein
MRKNENKDKVLEDLGGREEERQAREADILKELSGINRSLALSGTANSAWGQVEKHLRKMVRKTLMLN